MRGGLWVCAGLVAAALGCQSAPAGSDGGAGGGGGAALDCFEDRDCPDPRFFFCNRTLFLCEPACRERADCRASVRGEFALDFCQEPLGCQCEEGRCVKAVCASDAECGALVCRDGSCVQAPAASAVGSCRVVPDVAFLRTGSSARLTVETFDSTGRPLSLKDGLTWTALRASLMVVPQGAEATVQANASSASQGLSPGVSVSVGSATCSARIALVASAGPRALTAVVTDELTGRAISGARVMLSTRAGEVVPQALPDGGSADSRLTDALGQATLVEVPSPATVSAFHPAFGALTVAEYLPPDGGGAVLALPLRRNPLQRQGGHQGSFRNEPPGTSNILVGLVGMSIPGAVTSLSAAQLLGGTVPTDVNVAGFPVQRAVPIPQGVTLGLGTTPVKSTYAAQGLAGVCFDGGAVDEVATEAGTCGARVAFGLSGDVPLGEALPLFTQLTSGEPVDLPQVLGTASKWFRRFSSSVVREVRFSLRDTPRRPDGGGLDFSDTSHFTPTTLDFRQMPLSFPFAVNLPAMPRLRGAVSDAAFVLAAVVVPGQGLVPLGAGVGVNTAMPVNDLVDRQAGLDREGLVPVRAAPAHGGLEGGSYRLVAVALSSTGAQSLTEAAGASVRYHRLAAAGWPFDPTGQQPVDLSGDDFPLFPQRARFNFTATRQGGLEPRELKLECPDEATCPYRSVPGRAGVQVVRVTFTDDEQRRWDILLDPSRAEAGIRVPQPPAGVEDRTLARGRLDAPRSTLNVQLLRLAAQGPEVGFERLVELSDVNLDTLESALSGFSFLEYGRPVLTFLAPTPGAAVDAGTPLSLAALGLKVGPTATDDGVVRVSFSDGAGAPAADCPDVLFTASLAGTPGRLESVLPAQCRGVGLSLRAQALSPDAGSPLVPPVEAEARGVTIR